MTRSKGDSYPPSSSEPVSLKAELYSREIEKAAQRIGRRPEQAAQWLLRFERIERTEFEELSSGEWLDLVAEVACMAEYQYFGEERWIPALTWRDWYGEENVKEALSVADVVKAFQPSSAGSRISYKLPSRPILTELQEFVRLHLHELTESGGIVADHRPVRTCIVPRPDSDESLVIRIAESQHAVFQDNVVLLLTETSHRLRHCHECKIMFYADRKNKSYCSLRCQSRAGTRRWRGTPPERVGKLGRPPKESSKTKGNTRTQSAAKQGGSHGQ